MSFCWEIISMECLITLLALIWFIPCVYSYMFSNCTFAWKSFVTLAAMIRFLPFFVIKMHYLHMIFISFLIIYIFKTYSNFDKYVPLTYVIHIWSSRIFVCVKASSQWYMHMVYLLCVFSYVQWVYFYLRIQLQIG